jgi:GT2 family glycosyltransferase
MIDRTVWPSVTVIVLNYNGLEHLEACFASLINVDYPDEKLSLMLMDNGSTDGSVAYMQRHYPQVRIVRSEENLGFAAGNNLAAREAADDYVVFLNNDMRVDRQFVRGLLDPVEGDAEILRPQMQRPQDDKVDTVHPAKIVCTAAKILNWDGTRFDFVGSAAHFAGYAYQPGAGQPFSPDSFNEVRPLLFACGGAMLIDRQVFLDVGGFDEDYFAFYEDFDLGWRLWVLGYDVVFAPDAIVYHRHHATVSQLPDYRKRLLFKRNALYSVLKNYSDENLGQVLPAVLLATVDGVVTQVAQRGHLDPDAYHIQSTEGARLTHAVDRENTSTLVAIHDVVEHLPQVMEKRRWVQSHRKRSDHDVVRMFRQPFRFWPDVEPQTQYKVLDAFGIQDLFEDSPRRVLVISSDILPYPGMPTVGSGLRAWGVGQGLRSCGHEVVFSMPRAALQGRRDIAPPEAIEFAWEPDTLSTVIHMAEPDVVVVCNWPVMELVPVELINVPVILDQHGPHYLERKYQNFGDAEDNARRKVRALRKADFFTCAGEKQLGYFQSWLERAGWTEEERRERVAAIPVSLSPRLPARSAMEEGDQDLIFVYGGVFLPWQDPTNGLFALIEAMERRNRGTLYFFGGKHPVYTVDTGIFDTLLAQLKQSSHVITPGMVSHDVLIEKYTQAHVALDLMKRNPERELAFTTRTVEYLWCGLPVIYNDYAELSDYIREYNAGWTVDPEDRAAIEAVLDDIFENPAEVFERGRNAQRLARESLSWDKTIVPMDAFIRHPRMRAHEVPTGSVLVRNIKYLLNEAWFRYRHAGLRALWKEGWAFLRRRAGFL